MTYYDDWTVPLSENGTWLCEHTDADGNPAPPTPLNAAIGTEEYCIHVDIHQCFRLRCPDCGTDWRVWPRHRKAKYYAAGYTGGGDAFDTYPLRRAHTFDIDRITAAVRQALPTVVVTQHRYYLPDDDDGIWWFSVPDKADDVHIESDGMVPFLVETNEQCCTDARTAHTVEEAVTMIVEYLSTAPHRDLKTILEEAADRGERTMLPPQGISGRSLLRFVGRIDADSLAEMTRAINEGCGKVNPDAW